MASGGIVKKQNNSDKHNIYIENLLAFYVLVLELCFLMCLFNSEDILQV